MSIRTLLRGVSRFAQNGAPQSRRQTEQWQMLDDTIASASINDILVLPQKHSPGVGGLSRAMVVVASRAQQTCRIQQCGAVSPDTACWECARLLLFTCTVLATQNSGQSVSRLLASVLQAASSSLSDCTKTAPLAHPRLSQTSCGTSQPPL